MKTTLHSLIKKISLIFFLFFLIGIVSNPDLMAQPGDIDNENQTVLRNGINDGFAVFGLGFHIAQPANDYRDNNDKTGFGLGMSFGYDFPQSFITAGIDGMFAIYSTQTREEKWSETIPDARLDVETSNQIAAGHLFIRVQPGTGSVRPYIDGLFGFNYLWTDTKVKSKVNLDDDAIATSVDLDDIVLSYGISGGLMFPIWSPGTKAPGELFELLLDINAKYLVGGEAEYLKKDGKTIQNGQVFYQTTRSRTDMYNFRIGVYMRL